MKGDLWKLLHVFENEVRIEIVNLLLRFEMMSLSDIAEKSEEVYGRKISLPGLLKHIRELENIGIVRQESGGIVLEEPDARRTIYFLEGKERVQKILQQLETTIQGLLHAGIVFHETARLARKLQIGPRLFKGDKKRLQGLLAQCASKEINKYLTEDERKKVKFWEMMIALS